MTVLHSHKLSGSPTSYFPPQGIGGRVYAAKEMRRQVSKTQDKTKTTYNPSGMLTAGALRPCTGFDG